MSEVDVELPVLDVFVLSLLDRGFETQYALLQAGLSLGASTPSLSRLLARNLVSKSDKSTTGKRPRHEYRLTAAGKKAVARSWKSLLDPAAVPDDMDALLRVIDMSVHYGADRSSIASFIRHAADKRKRAARALSAVRRGTPEGFGWTYSELRFPLDDAKLRAEAKTLLSMAAKLHLKKAKSSRPRRTS